MLQLEYFIKTHPLELCFSYSPSPTFRCIGDQLLIRGTFQIGNGLAHVINDAGKGKAYELGVGQVPWPDFAPLAYYRNCELPPAAPA